MIYRNPALTVDLIIEVGAQIVLIERANAPLGWALPGGFVDEGEHVADAARREALEETGLDVEVTEQFYCYSDPGRDPRKHTVSVVFIARAEGAPIGGDDAARAQLFDPKVPPQLVFDHQAIIDDYLRFRATGLRPGASR